MDFKDQFRNDLIDAYRRAGENFLAYRLEKMFAEIKTEADRALHNEIAAEIGLMIGEIAEQNRPFNFLKSVANILINEKFEPKKRFLGLVASKILEFAYMKK